MAPRGGGQKKKEKEQAAAAVAAPATEDAATAPPLPPKGGKAAAKEKKEEVEVEETFEKDEIVLAKDNGQLYDAKVLKVLEIKPGAAAAAAAGQQYFIHFQGWKSKWDKWVPADELLKVNETNQKLQIQLREAAKKRPAAAAAALSGADGDKKEDGKRKKEGASKPTDPDVEPAGNNDPQVKIAMPFTLKKQLVDDWEMVTREPHQLVPLPRTPSVASVLASFMEQRKEKGSTSALQLKRFQELMEGIRMYFDKALPLILLYRQEREQYDRLLKAHTQTQQGEKETSTISTPFRPSDVYGAEHLLRLFVRLPHLLAQTAMSATEVTQVQGKLGEFLKYLQKQHGEFFLTSYRRREECLVVEGEGGEEGGEGGKKWGGDEEGGGGEKGRENEMEMVEGEKGEGSNEGAAAAAPMEVASN